MKRYFLALLLPVALLAGCGSLSESSKINYKSAGKLPPLEVPPDLTAPSRDERYAIPEAKATTFSSYAGGRSETSVTGAVLPTPEKMRVERSGTQRWLVVAGATPEQLWSQVKDFWQETGFIVKQDSPQTGIMETDWAENRAKIPQGAIRDMLSKFMDSVYSTPERDKFRTRLEKTGEGTEIYISHRGMYEIYTTEGRSDTRWQPRPADPELEAEMLRRLMVRLGASQEKAKSLVASEAASQYARLGPTGKSLQLQDPFDRAWRRVGLALDRIGFTVEDRDRNQGVYFVRYVDSDADQLKNKNRGFLDRLAFWRNPSATDKLKNAQMRIRIKGEGQGSEVSVLTREGGLDQSESSQKILALLLEQLK